MTTLHIDPANRTVVDEEASLRAAEAVEQCERLIDYLYPILQAMSSEHRSVREMALRAVFRQVELTIVLTHDPAELRAIKDRMGQFAHERLGLRFSKWSVSSIQRGVNFLGYRVWERHKLLRRSTVTRARRRLSLLRGQDDGLALERFVASWSGHASWADSHNLLISLGLEMRDGTEHIE